MRPSTLLRKHHHYRDKRFPFHIEHCVIKRNELITSHAHDFVELVFAVSGNADHELAGVTYRLKSGDVFVIEPNVLHSYRGSSDEDTIVYNVLFDPELLRQELNTLLLIPEFAKFFYLLPFIRNGSSFIPFQRLPEGNHAVILHHLETIHSEYDGMLSGWQLMVKTRFIECLVCLSRYLDPAALDVHGVSDLDWVDSVRHFIDVHYRESITLAQASHMCGISESTFKAKFKSATGRSLLDYKHDVQIREACKLLRDTDRKIVDIAMEVGFSDVSFFNKLFRKHRGITPKQYRIHPPT
jgi:AraC-like DNA-binding protein/quercetin dioxygenase-like cupin family protein